MENKKEGNIRADWGFENIWNTQLTFGREERELIKRDRIWASEIGKDHYQRYLKMNAIKPDFDFDERKLRVFEAGHFFERIVGFVLVSTGILIYDNKPYSIPEDKDHLKVSLRPDFIAGGKPDYEKAKKQIDQELLFKIMPNLGRIAEQLVKELSEKYPDGLKEKVLEIKSVNSQVFWAKKDYLSEAYPHHIMQCFTGMKASKIDDGGVIYISKDDLTIAEFVIHIDNEKLNEMWEEDVRKMTKYIRDGVEPPKPENIVFDERKKLRFQYLNQKRIIEGCYVKNWEISWSNYISRITGIKGKTQEEVCAKWEISIKDKLKEKNDKLKEEFKATPEIVEEKRKFDEEAEKIKEAKKASKK